VALALIFTVFFGLPFGATWVFGLHALLAYASPWTILTCASAGFLSVLFFHLLKAPTLDGRKIMDQIDGFKAYLCGEKKSANPAPPPELTPALYEELLPYAVALEVERQWTNQFAHIFARSGYNPLGAAAKSLTRQAPKTSAHF
jgi:hypothetical protein